MVKAIIFDMDGTLLDTEKHFVEAWQEAAHDCGVADFGLEHALQLRSLAAEFAEPAMKEIFGEDFPFMKVRLRRRELSAKRIETYGLETKEGVREALEILKAKGYKVAVATASDFNRASTSLKEVGLYDYFGKDGILCATEVEHGKPYPDVYEMACQSVGAKPEECIAVEDSPVGVTSAYRAGMQVFMIPDLTQPDFDTEQMLTKKVENITQLADIL